MQGKGSATKSRTGTATQQEEIQPGSPESQMMCSTSNFGSVANLKSKMSELEDEITKLQQGLDFFKKEFALIKSDKHTVDDMLDSKKKETILDLNSKLFRVDDELKKHLAHQKAENSRLQQQITQLKGEKTTINEQILNLDEDIKDLQAHVGHEDDHVK